MEQQIEQELIGTVIFLNENDGSKSECALPFLYLGRTVPPRRVLMEDDNPFENRGFTPYDGLVVKVTGHEGRSGVFLVDRITTPFEPSPSTSPYTDEEDANPESPNNESSSFQSDGQVPVDNK